MGNTLLYIYFDIKTWIKNSISDGYNNVSIFPFVFFIYSDAIKWAKSSTAPADKRERDTQRRRRWSNAQFVSSPYQRCWWAFRPDSSSRSSSGRATPTYSPLSSLQISHRIGQAPAVSAPISTTLIHSLPAVPSRSAAISIPISSSKNRKPHVCVCVCPEWSPANGFFCHCRTYFIVASRIVRPGQIYRVAVSILSSPIQLSVRASILRNGVDIGSSTQECKPGIPETLLIKVWQFTFHFYFHLNELRMCIVWG